MCPVLLMLVTDLGRHVRNLSAVMFAVVVPLALIGVMNLLLGSISGTELRPAEVAVAVPDGEAFGAAASEALRTAGAELGLTVREVAAQDVVALVDDGTVAAGVVVPEGFDADLLAGVGPQITLTLADDAGLEGTVVGSIVEGTLADLTETARVMAAAEALGAGPEEAAAAGQALRAAVAPVRWTAGETSDEQLTMSESTVAGQAGMFLFFTVGFGVLGLVSEREEGTLRRLLSMPIPGWSVVLAKGLGSLVLGVVSMAVLLTVSTLVFDDVDFGSPAAVALLVVLTVAAATALTFVVATLARTAEQANVAQAIIAVALGMSGGAFFPLAADGLLGTLLLVNPVTAFTRGLGITAGGGGVADLGFPVLVLSSFIVVCLLLTRLVPGRKDLL